MSTPLETFGIIQVKSLFICVSNGVNLKRPSPECRKCRGRPMCLPCLLEKAVPTPKSPFCRYVPPQCWGAVVADLRKKGRVAPSNPGLSSSKDCLGGLKIRVAASSAAWGWLRPAVMHRPNVGPNPKRKKASQ